MRRFAFIILLFCTLVVYSQQEKNNIFIFDCTNSMIKQNLWEPAKNTLHVTINNQKKIPGSRFSVIPFGDEPYTTISFNGTEYNQKKQKEIESEFEKDIKQAKFTHITEALQAGFAKCDPNRENKIYLLTDGNPNQGDTPQKVAETIRKWCASHINSRLFYVALKHNIIHDEIRKAVDECKDAYIVECQDGVIPQIADINPTKINTNIEELATIHNLRFSLPVDFPLYVECSDSIFKIEIMGGKASGGKIQIRILPRENLSVQDLNRILSGISSNRIYNFDFFIRSSDKDYFIANPMVEVAMADYIQSSLTLIDGESGMKVPGCSWYDSFLWSNASVPGEVEFDLTPVYKNVAMPDTYGIFEIIPAEGQKRDFSLFFNDKELSVSESNIRINPDSPAIIKFVFNNDAKTGDRSFILKLKDSKNLNLVNGTTTEEYPALTIQTKYSVKWNPLKIFLLWTAIIFLALLLLWLLCLKRIIYPTIRASRVELAGPGNYFISKKIKGMRKVVFTSRKRTQNVISRLMTGKILYIKADHFIPELQAVAGNKKRVRFRSNGGTSDGWDFIPMSTLSPYDKITVAKRSCNEKFEISLQ